MLTVDSLRAADHGYVAISDVARLYKSDRYHIVTPCGTRLTEADVEAILAVWDSLLHTRPPVEFHPVTIV